MVDVGLEDVPYLTLNVPQATFGLPDSDDEPKRHENVVELLDHRARRQRGRIAVGFPSCGDGANREESLAWSYGDLHKVSLEYAHRIHIATSDCIPGGIRQPTVIALLAPSGPEFLAHVLGCWRLGYAVLPIAIGTSTSGVAALMRSTGARLIFAHDSQKGQVLELVHGHDIQAKQWLQLQTTDTPQSNAQSFTGRNISGDDTLVIFHSSGSSGLPKPIRHPHHFWSVSTCTAGGTDLAAFTTTPLFHGGLSDLLRAIQAGASLYYFAWHEGKAPTAQNILGSVRTCPQPIHYFLSVPFILEMLKEDKEARCMLQQMDMVSTGGAPLPKHVGDAMVRQHNIKLVSRMGSSECGFLMSSWRRDYVADKDWQWLRLEDARTREWLMFQERKEDGLFELVVSRDWPTKILSNTGDGAFATNDLFERHAKYPHRWRYVRRADDNIVMVNGKKVAASPIEEALKAQDTIIDALIFGADRPILGAVVWSKVSGLDLDRRKEVAAALQSINTGFPSHARLAQEMVHIVAPDDEEGIFRNLPRSSKGTLQRGLALQQLATLIDGMYERFEQGDAPSTEERKDLHGNQLLSWLQETISSIAGRPVAASVDLYSVGVDSIVAARLRAAVHQHLQLGDFRLSSNAVYEQKTLQGLAQHIDSRQAITRPLPEEAAEMLARYEDVRKLCFVRSHGQQRSTVLLTGASGSLGSHILHVLLSSDKVAHVICLVRATDKQKAKERVRDALTRRRIPDHISTGRVTFITGIQHGELQRLLDAERAVVVHCAWIVNFALPLSSFEKDCLHTLRDLLKLYASCANSAHFLFCSSLAAVQSASSPRREAYSGSIADAGSTGYGQSKWVAEQICRMAGPQSGVTVARIGQLCGDTGVGIWNETEAWPLLVRTADEVGTLPAGGPRIDWMPVDLAAQSIVEITLKQPSAPVLHITLPEEVWRPSWTDFLGWLKTSSMSHFAIIPNEEWLSKVKMAGGNIRGRALLPIWSNMQGSSVEVFETRQAEKQSDSMRSVRRMDEELCHNFVRAWQTSGFLRQ